jgi:hypothetical protein
MRVLGRPTTKMNVLEGDAVAQGRGTHKGWEPAGLSEKECSWKKEAICQNAR